VADESKAVADGSEAVADEPEAVACAVAKGVKKGSLTP
jgi:hypothetical protein